MHYQPLLPMPELAVALPAVALSHDPFEGMMPSFMELSLDTHLRIVRIPKVSQSEPQLFIPEAARIQVPMTRRVLPTWLEKRRKAAKAQRQQRLKNLRRCKKR